MTTAKSVFSYGSALSSVAIVATPASAAIVQLSFSPNAVPYSGGGWFGTSVNIDQIPGGNIWQYNDTYGRTLVVKYTSVNAIAGITMVGKGQPLGSSDYFSGGIPGPLSYYPNGTHTIGFITDSNQVGWIRIAFGPLSTTIHYLYGAYNDTPGGTIIAGVEGAPIIPETSTTIALAGLSALAIGVGIREKRRRKAKVTA
ncbi:hypothetical protein [Cerasicoccus frondis]|uniref:hypothetical protein n=1 Tax=Cerasicoccus frondis TaxID=490090 RepID=UPI0028527BA9|nr:hypothetical protein [Cerasicoccus frondis]